MNDFEQRLVYYNTIYQRFLQIFFIILVFSKTKIEKTPFKIS